MLGEAGESVRMLARYGRGQTGDGRERRELGGSIVAGTAGREGVEGRTF